MGTSKLSGNPDEMLDVTCDAILLVASCHRNRDKLLKCGPLGLCADFYGRQRKSLSPCLDLNPCHPTVHCFEPVQQETYSDLCIAVYWVLIDGSC